MRTSSADRTSGAYSYVRQRAVLRVAERPVSGTVAKEVDGRHERRSGSAAASSTIERCTALSESITQSMAAGRRDDALVAVQKLMMLDPCEARWHQKHGEILRALGRRADAAIAYRRAARRFESLKQYTRAGAALRLADVLDATATENATVPLSPAAVARQCEQSQTLPVPAALHHSDAHELAADEESFAGLLE